MARLNLLLGYCLLGQAATGQNWQPLRSDHTASFSTTYLQVGTPSQSELWSCIGDCVLGVRLDSLRVFGIDTAYYFHKQLRSGFDGYCPSPSWLGNHMMKKPGGHYVFFNSNSDSVHFLPDSQWVMYTFADGRQVKATVNADTVAPVIDTIPTVTDSMKTILLSVVDSNGNSVSHALNGRHLVMSKNYGLVRTVDLFFFPEVYFYDDMQLVGADDIPGSYQNLTAKEIFDFQPGDEFHWKGEVHNGPYHSYQWKRWIIESKLTSSGLDTIWYGLRLTEKDIHVYPDPPADTNYVDTQVTKTYVLGGLSELDLLSLEGFCNADEIECGYLKSSLAVNRRSKWVVPHYSTSSEDSSCIGPSVGSGLSQQYDYREGLGVFRYENMDGVYDGWSQMVFYKKGSETWGTPIVFSGMDNPEDVLFSSFPNPAHDYLQLVLDPTSVGGQILMTDLAGRSILRHDITASRMTIDLASLSPGTYCLLVTTSRGISARKLVCKV